MRSPLPDRERRHLLQFHVAPRLTYGTRLLAALALVAGGLGLQLALLPGSPGPALAAGALVFAGNLLLLLKGYDLAPEGRSGGEWERTTIDRFEAAFHHDEKVRKWDSAFADVTCGLGCFSLLLFVLLPAAVLAVLVAGADGPLAGTAAVLLLDLLLLLAPHWFTGVRRKWKPAGLAERLRALRVALERLSTRTSPPCQIQPMLRVRREGDRQLPTDARVFVRFPDGPEDFLGLQLQVAVNIVQGTRFPYLYGVLVARKPFRLVGRHRGRVEALCEKGNLTVETKREEDVDVIVIRQHTTKKSGYHTNDAAVGRIATAVWACAVAVLEASAAEAAPSRD